NRAAIILAAGQGTRMKSATPKVLHKVAGLPMLGHVIQGLKAAGVSRLVVVVAPGAAKVEAYAQAQGCQTVVQDSQLGTGRAAAAPGHQGFRRRIYVRLWRHAADDRFHL